MPVTFQNNFNQQAAEIQQRQQLAQLLRQSMPEDQPFAQTGGKYSQVIRQNPLSAALRGLNQGVSAYMLTSAAKDQANLEGQKQQALSNLFSGDKEPGVSEMAQSGLFGGDVLAQALLRKQQAREVAQLRQSMRQGDGYHPPVAGSKGWIQYNPNTRSFEYMKIDGEIPLPGQYDPQNKYEMTKAAERPKFAEVELPTGAKTRMPNEQINPIYGNSQPPVFDFQNPQQAVQDLNGGVPVDPASAAQAKYDAFMRQNGLVTGQSTEQKENIKTNAAIREAEAKAQIDVQKGADKIIADDVAKTKAGLNQSLSDAKYTRDLLDGILSHPGLSGVVGMPSVSGLLRIPGTNEASFRELLKQVEGRQFLEAFDRLRGGGQITEKEGEAATKAMARLGTAQKETDFVAAVNELKQIIASAEEREKSKADMASPMPPAQGGNIIRYDASGNRIR